MNFKTFSSLLEKGLCSVVYFRFSSGKCLGGWNSNFYFAANGLLRMPSLRHFGKGCIICISPPPPPSISREDSSGWRSRERPVGIATDSVNDGLEVLAAKKKKSFPPQSTTHRKPRQKVDLLSLFPVFIIGPEDPESLITSCHVIFYITHCFSPTGREND